MFRSKFRPRPNATQNAALKPVEPSSKIKDIEPILKWAAVAYAAGFLTVMLHTHRLGIPVMQLIEPIYILVGTPLALTLFFVEPLMQTFKRKRELLRQEMSEVDRKLDAIRELKTPQEAAQASVKALTEMINMTTAVLGLVVPMASDLLRVLTKALMPYLKKTIDKNLDNEPDKARLDLIKFSVNLDRVTRTVLVLSRFGLRLLPLALILLTLVLYTFLVYPVIPQSLGGGKPSQARLVVDVEKIPQDDSNLRDIFPQSVIDKRPPGSATADSDKVKSMTTCLVALQYQTEHAYYIRHQSGPILVINHDAVNGIIVSSAKDQQPQGCS
jgi:hypothetical protein